jgi:hypothetical protein
MTKPALPDDLLWGGQAIARHIKRTVRQTYYLVENGLIPATKLGARTIVARASELDRAFSNGDTPATNNATSTTRPAARAHR